MYPDQGVVVAVAELPAEELEVAVHGNQDADLQVAGVDVADGVEGLAV